MTTLGFRMFDAEGCYDVGVDQATHWIVTSVSRANRFGDTRDYWDFRNVVSLRAAARTLRGKKVTSLCLDTDAPEPTGQMEWLLRDIPGLRRLMLPSQFAPGLRPEMIGRDVRELFFYGWYDRQYWKNKTVTLTSQCPFRGIELLTGPRLSFRCEVRFRFGAEVFPNLRAIAFTFDAKRRFGDTLRRLMNLVAVGAACFDSIEQLAGLLDTPKLLSLTLAWNGKLGTLAGIERFPNLRYLKVTSLTRLRTLDELAASSNIKHVGVYWCGRLDDPFALLRMPSLKSIATFGNGHWKPQWRALREQAAARGIDTERMF